MSRNGSGTYSLPAGNPVTTGTAISSAVHNTTLNDIAAEITNSVARDGQAAMTGQLDMGTQKIKNVGNGTVRTDALTLGQAQDGSFQYVSTVGGTANAITLTPSPAIPAYVAGQCFSFKVTAANTGATTVAISGLAAKNITKRGATALASGDLPINSVVFIQYDGTQFQVDRVADVVTTSGSQTVSGKTFTSTTLTSPTVTTPTVTDGTFTTPTFSSPTINTAVSGTAVASTSQVSTGTATNLITPPGRMAYHPGVAKAWVQFDGTQATGALSVANGYGMLSVVKNGTGDFTATVSTAFANASYPDPIVMCGGGAGAVYGGRSSNNPTKTTTAFRFETRGTNGTLADAVSISVIFFGNW